MKVFFPKKLFHFYCTFWILQLIFVIFIYFDGASERRLIYNFSLSIIGLIAIAIITVGRLASAMIHLTNTLKDNNIRLVKSLFGEESDKNQ